ncbi:MAG: hypothetical protein JO314_07475, partial [Acidobacteria bacterium]|nr:hypothetical protein [Acidobacteriota bacterium]
GAKTEVMPPVHVTQPTAEPAAEPQPVAMAASASAGASVSKPAGTNGKAQTSDTPAKKKGSKMPFVLGALVGVVILAGGAGGGGWYYYNNIYKSKVVTPTPESGVQPTPIPTINVVDSSTPEPSNTNVAAPSPTPEKDVVTSGPSTKPTPQGVSKGTDTTKPNKPAATKPPPKKGDDRTVIMQ